MVAAIFMVNAPGTNSFGENIQSMLQDIDRVHLCECFDHQTFAGHSIAI